MINAIDNLITDHAKLGIVMVENGSIEVYENTHMAMGQMHDILVKLGFEKSGDLDSNGWDSDYWQTYAKNNKKYTLAGSGYYGGISFELDTMDLGGTDV